MSIATMRKIEELSRRCSAVLTGHEPSIQGAVLADLLAMWIAGHIVEGSPRETAHLHKMMLKEHMLMVRELIPVNAEGIHG